MAYSSKFPCCYCVATIKGNRLCDDAELRTIGSISMLAKKKKSISLKVGEEDLEDDNDTCDNDNEYSVVGVPIFMGPDDKLIVHSIPPPPLHLMLGLVNLALKKFEAFNKVLAEKWLAACSIQRSSSFGRELNGNSCKNLLKRVGMLDKAVALFKKANKIIDSCF